MIARILGDINEINNFVCTFFAVPKSWWKKGIALFCGLEDQEPPELTDEDRAELHKLTDITEDPKQSFLVNIGAIAMGAALCFLFGFYA